MVFKVFFVISFPPCDPTTLASLLPGVVLLNHITGIEKTFRKSALEQERPNGSVVKIGDFSITFLKLEILV